MGFSYSQHRMIGCQINGMSKSVEVFLKENGYDLNEDEIVDFFDNSGFYGELAKKYNADIDIKFICLNSWSGHDFFIGYDLGLKEEHSKEAQELQQKFKTNFPRAHARFSSFTSVG